MPSREGGPSCVPTSYGPASVLHLGLWDAGLWHPQLSPPGFLAEEKGLESASPDDNDSETVQMDGAC